MKKGIVKRILKYVGIAILIAYFLLNATLTSVDYVYAKSYIFADVKDETREELISDLKELENTVNEMANSYKTSDMPALGAAVATVIHMNSYYNFEVLMLSIIIGIISGVLVYIIKNVECKKIVHYVIMYFLFLIVIAMICMIAKDLINSIFFSETIMNLHGTSIEGFIDNILVIVIPYTIVYLDICVVIYMVSKRKAKDLNSNM